MEVVDFILSSGAAMHTVLQRRLQKYQASMKSRPDAHRRDIIFAVGDWVYVKLRPYRQTSIQPTYSKLSKRYYGSFMVQARVGAVAYCLQLPPNFQNTPYFPCIPS